MLRERNFYHPISMQSDLVRRNMFELIIDSRNDSLRILCKSLTLQHPKSNNVPVPWMGGIMQLAGRSTSQFMLNATFLVGTDNESDTLEELYKWRNDAFNHVTGKISLANKYKKDATVIIYDVTGENSGKKYTYKVKGLWPTDISDLTFSVEEDAPLEIITQFAADMVYIEEFTN